MTSQNVFWLRSVAPPGPDTACHRPPVPAPQVHPSRSPRSPALALDELYGLLFLSAGQAAGAKSCAHAGNPHFIQADDTSGVNAGEHFDAVTGPFGDIRRKHPEFSRPVM